MERKDSIRRFLREQFRDDKKSKENKENNVVTATTGASVMATSSLHSETALKGSKTETKTKSSAYRLFRTVRIYNIYSDAKFTLYPSV